jgi:hypothetical protein
MRQSQETCGAAASVISGEEAAGDRGDGVCRRSGGCVRVPAVSLGAGSTPKGEQRVFQMAYSSGNSPSSGYFETYSGLPIPCSGCSPEEETGSFHWKQTATYT